MSKRESRAAVRLATVKRLFARSLNRCAFPGCHSMIVDDESDVLLGEICHIEGIGKKALRYNKELSKEERDAYGNLILLCANHHTIIDRDKTYTVESLKRMKAEHEEGSRMETEPKDERYARICINKVDARRTRVTLTDNSRVYNNSQHIEAPNGVINVYGPAPRKMSAPPDSIQNDAKKRAYIERLRTILIDADTYHPDRATAASIINKSIKKTFGTTALLVSVDYFNELCAFIKNKIDKTIPGRKSLKDKGRPLYDPFVE